MIARMLSPLSALSALARRSTVFPPDLSVVSTRRLHSLSNRMYRELDGEQPLTDTPARYLALCEELTLRDTTAPMTQIAGGTL